MEYDNNPEYTVKDILIDEDFVDPRDEDLGASSTRREQAAFAEQDSKAFEDLAMHLKRFHWEVDACGRDGTAQMRKAREAAKDAIKRLANYL